MPTVRELREALENYDDEMEVMIVHQPGWPLREVLGGLYEPGNTGCEECDQEQGAPIHTDEEHEEYHKYEGSDDGQVLYLVANGHPDSPRSPYGSKEAWDGMERL